MDTKITCTIKINFKYNIKFVGQGKIKQKVINIRTNKINIYITNFENY